MSAKCLEDLLGGYKTPTAMLFNQPTGAFPFPGVPPEFSNWRDEQRSWQESCALFNLSYHMSDLLIGGPDAFKLLAHLASNSFEGFTKGKAKQFVPCSHAGYIIGDSILLYLDDNKFELVGRPPTLNWVRFHAEKGSHDVRVELDEPTAVRKDPNRRRSYRFQVQGPNALKVMERVLGGTVPAIKFFNLCKMTIAGKPVTALRHGMAGQPGFELFGPWDDGETIKHALVEAGRDFGLRQVGGRAYSTPALESGWIPSPLPAVYSGDSMQAYRKWLPADGYEATASLGGSFYSENIEDYYLTPWDMGYGPFVKFDHDFIGRAALEKRANGAHRKKVTLALDGESVARVMSSMFRKGDKAKYMEFPNAAYAMHPYDAVLVDGKGVGISTWIGYSANESKMLSLAILAPEHSVPGTRVNLLWGEQGGGSAKPRVERHVQTEISAVVCTVPYSEVARTSYAESWRTRQKT